MSTPPPPFPVDAVPPPSPESTAQPGLPTRSTLSTPVDYVWLTRPGRAWWRLPLSLLLFLAIWVVIVMALGLALMVLGAMAGSDLAWLDAMDDPNATITPMLLLFTGLLLAALIPAAIISTWVTQRIRPGYVHSVAGRFRWRFFGEVTLILFPVWLGVIALQASLSGGLFSGPGPESRIVVFTVILWLTIPLQAAGEEYAFRGWLLQNIGGLIPNRLLAWAVPTILSAAVFAVAHGSFDPWILIDLGIFATATVLMIWRTGGLEAAISLHILNNVIVLQYQLINGGIDDVFVSSETTGSVLGVVFSLVTHAIAVAVVWWWAARRGVQRTTLTDPRIRPRHPLPPAGTLPPTERLMVVPQSRPSAYRPPSSS
ncbi:MAG: CPBP family intramembrane metalloprotease [Propionibacteriaceae bacterium]|nr:CPBP family intramembrane metalloprotease [Propionibacteriaceae bacterium]